MFNRIKSSISIKGLSVLERIILAIAIFGTLALILSTS